MFTLSNYNQLANTPEERRRCQSLSEPRCRTESIQWSAVICQCSLTVGPVKKNIFLYFRNIIFVESELLSFVRSFE